MSENGVGESVLSRELLVKSIGSGKREVVLSGVQILLIELWNYLLISRQSSPYVLTHNMKRNSIRINGQNGREEDQEDEESVERRLIDTRIRFETLGFDIGQRLIERVTYEHSIMQSHLDIIKFICKDFWESIFGKQVNVLKTNRKGLFVLQDSQFPWTYTFSKTNNSSSSKMIEDFALFPCAIISGALSRLGMKCRVSVDVSENPVCTFTVQVI